MKIISTEFSWVISMQIRSKIVRFKPKMQQIQGWDQLFLTIVSVQPVILMEKTVKVILVI